MLAAAGAANALIFLDQTVVTVALPAMQRDFDSSTAEVQWTVSAYLLVLAAVMPASGRLADLYGRKRLFVAGLAVFGAASLACAAAPSELALIFARALQGVGAALAQPLALASATAALPAERRGWAIGVLATLGTSCLALGPLIGGALVETAGWRWIFLLNLPVVAAGLALAVRFMSEWRTPEARRPDVPGLILLTGALTVLVAMLLHLRELPTAADAAALALAAVLLGAFAAVEQRSDHPLIPLRLLRPPAVAGSLGALFAIQFAVLGVTVYVVLYLQAALGLTALEAGLVLLPSVIWTPLLSMATGRLADRRGGRRIVGGGLFVAAAGLVAIAVAVPFDRALLLAPGLLAFGIARPFVFTPAGSGAVSAIPARHRGLASSLVTEARQLGAVLGVAVLGSIVAAFETGGTGTAGDGLAAAMIVAAAVAAVAGAAALALMPRAGRAAQAPPVKAS